MPTIRPVWQLIQCVDYAFSIDLSDAYLYIPVVTHLCNFYNSAKKMSYQWKVLPFGLATAPRVFTAPTKPILFLCWGKGSHIVINLDDIFVLLWSKQVGRRA